MTNGATMNIDPAHFRALVREAIDDNPFCCRAVLSVCRIEFTRSVPSLSVSLGESSVLRVNLDFVAAHCRSEMHVKALVLHEFLHILLGHTVRFARATPALNVALDAIINAILHRKLGPQASGMMALYYAGAQGPVRLLRPPEERELRRQWELARNKSALSPAEAGELEHLRLHVALYQGKLVSDDLLAVTERLASEELEQLLAGGPSLLGTHDPHCAPLDGLPDDLLGRIRQSFAAMRGEGIWRNPDAAKPQVLRTPEPRREIIPPAWRAQTLPVIRRLLQPDARAPRVFAAAVACHLPILHAADRRGSLRSLWNPLVPEVVWPAESPRAAETVQIYLDVSGSMLRELQALVRLLADFQPWIRRPLWAFSDVVRPAAIVRGRLVTETTGGTSLDVVLDHIRSTRPRKALVITDGFVEVPTRALPECRIEALIPCTGERETLEGARIPVTVLAAFQ